MYVLRTTHPRFPLAEVRRIIRLVDYTFHPGTAEHRLTLPLLALILSDLPHPPIPVASSIAFQTLLGLAHLHSLGTAHRDLKPGNVMLDWDGSVKLIDFGTAWTSETGESEGGMVCDVGSGPYRAPELLFGPRTYDALATDLWAAGCVIAEMFHMGTPSPPYSDVDHVEERGEEDDDPLETPVDSTEIRATLFDSTFGNLGLAASIFRLRGSPNRHTWPVGPLPLCSLYSAHYPSSQEFSNLPDAGKIEFDTFPPTSLSSVILDAPPDAVDFIDQLLALSPGRRIVAEDALDHTWFRGEGVLLPKGRRAWFGVGPDRRELDPGRIVEAVDGVSLVQLLETEFDEARQRYARIVAERG